MSGFKQKERVCFAPSHTQEGIRRKGSSQCLGEAGLWGCALSPHRAWPGLWHSQPLFLALGEWVCPGEDVRWPWGRKVPATLLTQQGLPREPQAVPPFVSVAWRGATGVSFFWNIAQMTYMGKCISVLPSKNGPLRVENLLSQQKPQFFQQLKYGSFPLQHQNSFKS